ncbi:hypothetical protein [Streptomyces sp. DH12]|uniref:hypothetical protein n=1 Tax=Streptomyces sp. DH12 TaxID=2857010 RepID=UPI001E636509|nr:hypothetical protein [Streptomyces sp. DH12]
MSAPRVPDPGRPADDPEYSATALAAHWSDHADHPDHPGRAVDPGRADRPERPARSAVAGLASGPVGPARPDRVEGTVLRFGPGVTATAVARPGGGADPAAGPPPAPSAPRRRARGRRYALPVLVLLCVLALLGRERYGPAVAVHGVAVRTDGVAPAGGATCGGTADVVGVVRTDGRPGTLTYRWLRGDGTTSGVLTERVPGGRREVRLHLLWTFDGEGAYRARADLEVLSPGRHAAGTVFTYACGEGR